MKTAKRLMAMLLVAALLAVTPAAAMAAEYVPTKGTYYWKNGTKWQKGTEYTWSYKGDGKIKKVTYKEPDGYSSSTTYKWKGSFLKTLRYSGNEYTSYKFKNNRLQSMTDVYGSNKETGKFKWDKKKKKGTYKGDGFTNVITVNSKGQRVKQSYIYSDGTYTYSYKYYSNGNVKSISLKGPGYSFSTKYNKAGYLTSRKSSDGYSYTCKYKKNKKGQITEKITKYNSGGENKIVYTKWKKVSRTWNCDGFGTTVSLG